MNLTNFIGRELTDTEKNTIDRFRYYFNEHTNFALIGENTVITLEQPDTIDGLKQKAEEAMTVFFSQHPDFSAYLMDDEYGMVSMFGNLLSVTSNKLSDKELQNGEVDMKTALELRAYSLSSCEKGVVRAIIEEEQPIASDNIEEDDEEEYYDSDFQKELDKKFDELYGSL